jgi:enoyl-CoA hydratase/carnithine racemase
MVLFEVIGQVHRPEKCNAINSDMSAALGSAIDRIESDPQIRAGVLRANMAKGRAVFCAGHDLTHFRETYGTDEEDAVTTRRGGFAA